MKKVTLIFSYIMFSITLVITLFMFVSIILGVVIIKEVPPIIVFAIMTGLFLLLALHYFKCIKFQNHNQIDSKLITKNKNINSILAFIFGFFSVTMFIVGIYPILLYGQVIDVALIFIFAGLFFALYSINLVMINKSLNIND